MRIHFLAGCLSAVLLCGCGGPAKPDLLPVSGEVKLDGQPLDQGLIHFEPAGGAEVNAGAPIDGGKYQLTENNGLLPGSYKVAISSQSSAAGESADPIQAMRAASQPQAERIPAKYNAQTELQIEIKAAEPNHFDFDLTSSG